MNTSYSITVKLLNILEKKIFQRLNSGKAEDKVYSFFRKVRLLLKKIDQAQTSNPEKELPQSVTGNLLNDITFNIKILLETIPESEKTPAMKRLPQAFAATIDKMLRHIQEDESFLSYEVQGKKEPVFETEINQARHKQDGKRQDNHKNHAVPMGNHNASAITYWKDKDPGYPIGYHSLSSDKTTSYILLPLFDMLFPKNSAVTASMHCKRTTKKNLESVLRAKLGPDGSGNKLLYRIFSDDVLKKIFNDDSIISEMYKSLNIVILKVAILTALYRLEKHPDKFSEIGGVIFFAELEREMLSFTKIHDFFVRFITTPQGAEGVFLWGGARERKILYQLISADDDICKKIYLNLPEIPEKAKEVTKYWPPKFAGLIVSGIYKENRVIADVFDEKQLSEIKDFLRFLSK